MSGTRNGSASIPSIYLCVPRARIQCTVCFERTSMTLLGHILTDGSSECLRNQCRLCMLLYFSVFNPVQIWTWYKRESYPADRFDNGGCGPMLRSEIREFQSSHSSQICMAHRGKILGWQFNETVRQLPSNYRGLHRKSWPSRPFTSIDTPVESHLKEIIS